MMKTKNYETPSMVEQELYLEGILCISDVEENESYGGDPGEDDSIF